MATQEYETLKRLVAEAEEDVNKAFGGNKAAGTRVRKKCRKLRRPHRKCERRFLKVAKARQAFPRCHRRHRQRGWGRFARRARASLVRNSWEPVVLVRNARARRVESACVDSLVFRVLPGA